MESSREVGQLPHRLRTGINLPEAVYAGFNAEFLDEHACRELLSWISHPGGARCPKCGSPLPGSKLMRWQQWKRIKCEACGCWFSARSHTPLSSSRLSAGQMALMLFLLNLGLVDAAIAARVQTSSETVRRWRKEYCGA